MGLPARDPELMDWMQDRLDSSRAGSLGGLMMNYNRRAGKQNTKCVDCSVECGVQSKHECKVECKPPHAAVYRWPC